MHRPVLGELPVDVVVVHLGGERLAGEIDVLRPVEADAVGPVPLHDIHFREQLDIGAHPYLEPVLRLRLQLRDAEELLSLGVEMDLLCQICLLHLGRGVDDHHPFVPVYDNGVVVLAMAVTLPRPTTAGISRALADDRGVGGAAAHVGHEPEDLVEVELDGVGRRADQGRQ